ncbi:hypothetical protein D3C83_305720 [compost metagenome]
MMSVLPPAANGTTRRTALDGKVCACAVAAAASRQDRMAMDLMVYLFVPKL